MTARPAADTISPQLWRRVFERLGSDCIDWEWVAEQMERGCTGKIEIDIKDGQARGGRVMVVVGK